ncbi:hypothetical protein TcG_10867, partial [Trypanosoma cruzi]
SRKEPLIPLSLAIKGPHAWDASCLVWHEEQQRIPNVANAGLTVQCGEYNTLDLPEDRRAHFSPPVADTILGQPRLCRTERPFGERQAAPPTCRKTSQKEFRPTCGTLPCNFNTLTSGRAFLPESVRPHHYHNHCSNHLNRQQWHRSRIAHARWPPPPAASRPYE